MWRLGILMGEILSNEILAFNIEILLYPILYIKNRDSSQTKDLACIQFPENYTQIRLYITRMKRSSVNLAKLVVIYLFVCTWDKGFKPTLSKPTRSDELSNNYILFHCIVANSNHIDYLILWLLNSSLNIGWKKHIKKGTHYICLVSYMQLIADITCLQIKLIFVFQNETKSKTVILRYSFIRSRKRFLYK